jgi:hypothetical protein
VAGTLATLSPTVFLCKVENVLNTLDRQAKVIRTEHEDAAYLLLSAYTKIERKGNIIEEPYLSRWQLMLKATNKLPINYQTKDSAWYNKAEGVAIKSLIKASESHLVRNTAFKRSLCSRTSLSQTKWLPSSINTFVKKVPGRDVLILIWLMN